VSVLLFIIIAQRFNFSKFFNHAKLIIFVNFFIINLLYDPTFLKNKKINLSHPIFGKLAKPDQDDFPIVFQKLADFQPIFQSLIQRGMNERKLHPGLAGVPDHGDSI
jgi:hypothetical protein